MKPNRERMEVEDWAAGRMPPLRWKLTKAEKAELNEAAEKIAEAVHILKGIGLGPEAINDVISDVGYHFAPPPPDPDLDDDKMEVEEDENETARDQRS